ncbi:unnamed protein product [Musa textilis]
MLGGSCDRKLPGAEAKQVTQKRPRKADTKRLLCGLMIAKT